jgi:hypothetical protein
MDENFLMSSTKRDLLSKISSSRASRARRSRMRIVIDRDDDGCTIPSHDDACAVSVLDTATFVCKARSAIDR